MTFMRLLADGLAGVPLDGLAGVPLTAAFVVVGAGLASLVGGRYRGVGGIGLSSAADFFRLLKNDDDFLLRG